MELSLILATRNNANVLSGFLSNLTLCLQPQNWELIIIDNDSSDGTSGLVNSFADKLPVKYVHEGTPGKSRALNRGIKQVRGDIVLFTDDDIIPDKYWLVNTVKVMQAHPDINVLGGRINVNKSLLPAWLVNSFNLMGILVTEHNLGDREVIYDCNRYPFGPNMAVRKSVIINQDNLWPENLGPGTDIPVGDEMVFIQNLGKAGGKRLYTPDCIVEHKPVVHNNFFIKSIKRCFLGGYTTGRYLKNQVKRKEKNSFLRRAFSKFYGCKSLREFVCIFSRAAGVFFGNISQWYFREFK